MHTQVLIVGGGPAGSLLAQLLHQQGIESVILERRSTNYVRGRIRAGVLEHGSAATLRAAGVGRRMDESGQVHEGVMLATDDDHVRIDFAKLVGRSVTIWGQTEVQADLYDALQGWGAALLDGAEDVALHDLETTRPRATFHRDGEDQQVTADWIIGCDGAHGVSRTAIPSAVRRSYERSYPFGWLGILSKTEPLGDELIYASHERGFALCSMRHATLSRYYLQCDVDDRVDAWSDDRFWTELTARLPASVSTSLQTGPSIDKSITPLRSRVDEPMRHGRLLLAGDAAHIVPPTGAKGLNLAIGDVVLLAHSLKSHYDRGDDTALDTYSSTALRRVWQAVRFSWWLTTLMHRFPDSDAFDRKLQLAEFDRLAMSAPARAAFAASYTGAPGEEHDSTCT